MKTTALLPARFLIFWILMFVVGISSSCKRKLEYISETNGKQKNDQTKNPENNLINSVPYDSNHLIIWMKPGSNPADFRFVVDSIANEKNFTKQFCAKCDSTLALLTGPGASTSLEGVAQGATGGSGGTGSGPNGGGEFYWFVNFNMDVNDPIIQKENNNNKPIKSPVTIEDFQGPPVVVGVLDTGVDPDDLGRTGFLYDGTNMGPSCLDSSATSGWNFPAWDSRIVDDYHLGDGHGANVAAIIKKECIRIRETPVKILPVKVIPANGPATLYHFLCGLVYAKERGAKIINASLGYYPCLEHDIPDSGSIIFKEYIKYYLTRDSILLIAAGGNLDPINQNARCRNTSRSLDEMHFYPASFASDPEMQNVIAVTTIYSKWLSHTQVSPHQNYSDRVIDIGVNADLKSGDIFGFENPRFQGDYIEGSSYATPNVAGLIAGKYNWLLSKGINMGQKSALIDLLKGEHLIVIDNDLKQDHKVRDGNCYNPR